MGNANNNALKKIMHYLQLWLYMSRNRLLFSYLLQFFIYSVNNLILKLNKRKSHHIGKEMYNHFLNGNKKLLYRFV